jgi:acetolactate synthase-1/2/3 large subunit
MSNDQEETTSDEQQTDGARLFVRCLENEEVEYIFGIPGEENIAVMDALLDSDIKFILTRHEQGAAFMADVYGRLTGKPGVCLATLGPGATNLITGVADANMDFAPIVAIAGQGATTRLHKESHQVLDLVNMFAPISKYSTQIRAPEVIPEIVRKAFKDAAKEKPGASFIEFPENIGSMPTENVTPLLRQAPRAPVPPPEKIREAAQLIDRARFPLIMAGNGIIRAGASDALVKFAEDLNIPVATTFMAKGVMANSHPLSLGTVGLQANDYVACGFDRADLIICVGYDMIEYHPHLWNKRGHNQIVHIDSTPAEVDARYQLASGVLGDINAALPEISALAEVRHDNPIQGLREALAEVVQEHANDSEFPIKPQKILWDLRQAMNPEDILISDVGAHKMWVARMFQAQRPNTCIISNGFASMGIGVPGAIAAKMVHPDRNVVTVTGDAGFLMNSQEIETAMRLELALVILVWNDSEYGLIKWHQLRHYGRESNIRFTNPDLVAYAESFGAKGYRVESTEQLLPTLQRAFADNTVVLIDCPVDYRENMKLTEQLGNLVCPI